jgi:hypothetical protein
MRIVMGLTAYSVSYVPQILQGRKAIFMPLVRSANDEKPLPKPGRGYGQWVSKGNDSNEEADPLLMLLCELNAQGDLV